MNLVSRNGSRVVVRQVPFLLLFVTAIFGLLPLASSLFLILSGTDADGKIFGLFFGLFMLWLFLEFVATRERIEIDLDGKMLKRSVSGVFRRKKQVIDLSDIKAIVLEVNLDVRGRRRQYLYMYGSEKKHLLNSPSKVYINHGKLGRVLSEVTGIPYQVQDYGFYS
ncbi:MAG: hypothetical protein ACR2HX_02465 [Pyrinomonadaceae bacterium]